MKKLLAIVLAAAFLAVALVQWHSYRAAASPLSTSQIFIHGTPVCVFSRDGNILARVGECPDGRQLQKEIPPERMPFHGHPGLELPPGHPPVDREMTPEGRRAIPI